jgi:hypothetical protein
MSLTTNIKIRPCIFEIGSISGLLKLPLMAESVAGITDSILLGKCIGRSVDYDSNIQAYMNK